MREETTLSVDVAIIDSTGDCHLGVLRLDGVGAAASAYNARKWKKYSDFKGLFSLLFLPLLSKKFFFFRSKSALSSKKRVRGSVFPTFEMLELCTLRIDQLGYHYKF